MNLAQGNLRFDVVQEMREMIKGICSDLKDRADSVEAAIRNGLDKKSNPDRLPENIYGTHGEWEDYSTPSRDARLKTSAVELRNNVEKLVDRYMRGDSQVVYKGRNLKNDLLNAYTDEAEKCQITYANSAGKQITLTYDRIIQRLFKLSFDPYHCVELRWGANLNTPEGATCRDSSRDIEWYVAQQYLRNQTERAYDARMGFSLSDLKNKVQAMVEIMRLMSI